jgi:hypothetical protein
LLPTVTLRSSAALAQHGEGIVKEEEDNRYRYRAERVVGERQPLRFGEHNLCTRGSLVC